MIRPLIRLPILNSFPPGTPLLVIAPAWSAYDEVIAYRGDPATVTCALAHDGSWHHPGAREMRHVLLEGLDDVDDPVALLEHLRDAAPYARLFALVSNACNLVSLERFYTRSEPTPIRPLVDAQIAPLFDDGGWRIVERRTIPDDLIPDGLSAPFPARIGAVEFQIKDEPMLERARVAAFFVIADRR